MYNDNKYFSLYMKVYIVLYDMMYNDNIYLSLYKTMYYNGSIFYYTRRCIITIFISHIYESVFLIIHDDV